MVESSIGLDDSGNLNGGLMGKEEDDPTLEAAPQSSASSRRRNRRRRQPKELKQITTLIFHPVFVVLFGLLVLATCISFFLVLNHPDDYAVGSVVSSAIRKNNQQHKVTNQDLKALQAKLGAASSTQKQNEKNIDIDTDTFLYR